MYTLHIYTESTHICNIIDQMYTDVYTYITYKGIHIHYIHILGHCICNTIDTKLTYVYTYIIDTVHTNVHTYTNV